MQIAVDRAAGWVSGATDASSPTICVMAHSLNARDEIARRLAQRGVATSSIDADTADASTSTAVRVSTMHRAKGLEFDRVAVVAPGMLTNDADSDLPNLVYVSLTRAKSVALLIT